MFLAPRVATSELAPTAVFWSPLTLAVSDAYPSDVLLLAVVNESDAVDPTAVL